MKFQYFYVLVTAPGVQAGIFYRKEVHPLTRQGLRDVQTSVARTVSMQPGRAMLSPDAVTITWLYPLPEEVARDLFPDDFKE